ncbi:uncharacterized protein LOC123450507 [Hordeum vulgare subsp. vulgare]|uniref:uncharacterized protein LOC123450507 n=1 Tax=Hordeum vulgare subsp. vulgare TaxID=112509 RepID=UPI001D1A50D9|nr:uncharacterized protein LOC123450507 [Hordeum vulgare subsp. vulgare]
MWRHPSVAVLGQPPAATPSSLWSRATAVNPLFSPDREMESSRSCLLAPATCTPRRSTKPATVPVLAAQSIPRCPSTTSWSSTSRAHLAVLARLHAGILLSCSSRPLAVVRRWPWLPHEASLAVAFGPPPARSRHGLMDITGSNCRRRWSPPPCTGQKPNACELLVPDRGLPYVLLPPSPVSHHRSVLDSFLHMSLFSVPLFIFNKHLPVEFASIASLSS